MTRRYNPDAIYNYTPVLRPMPVPDDLDQHDAWDCVHLPTPRPMVAYVLGLAEMYRWPDRVAGTSDEQELFRSLWLQMMSDWIDAMLCKPCTTGVVNANTEYYYQSVNESTMNEWYSNVVNAYETGGIDAIAPEIADAGADATLRERAQCLAWAIFVESVLVTVHTSRAQYEALAGDLAQGASVTGAVAAIASSLAALSKIGAVGKLVGAGTAVALGAAGGWLALSAGVMAIASVLLNALDIAQSEKPEGPHPLDIENIICCSQPDGAGVATLAEFQALLNDCPLENEYQNALIEIVGHHLTRDAYILFLQMANELYNIADAGSAALPPCLPPCGTPGPTDLLVYDFSINSQGFSQRIFQSGTYNSSLGAWVHGNYLWDSTRWRGVRMWRSLPETVRIRSIGVLYDRTAGVYNQDRFAFQFRSATASPIGGTVLNMSAVDDEDGTDLYREFVNLNVVTGYIECIINSSSNSGTGSDSGVVRVKRLDIEYEAVT